MRTYLSEGRCITILAERDIEHSKPVIIGATFGIPATSAKAGEEFELYVTGIHQILRDESKNFKNGEKVFFEPDSSRVTTDAKKVLIGVCSKTPEPGDDKVKVRLNGISI
jgi:predicted RecA/RadA family phage recombinase